MAVLILGTLTETGSASQIGRNEVTLKESQIKLWNTIVWNNAVAENQRQQEIQATQIKPARQQRKGSVTIGSGRCGGDLPPCSVMMCESGGDLTAHNPSGADGKWQIIPSTWNNFKGYPTPSSAPEAVQDEKAAQLYAGGKGRGQWVC